MKPASSDRIRRRIAPVWKFLGIAGLVSVAAGGVLVARNERTRRAYTPDQVRERLHQRAARAEQAPPADAHEQAPPQRP